MEIINHRYTEVLLVTFLVLTVTCAGPASQASGETVSTKVDSGLKVDNIKNTNSEQTATKVSSQVPSIPVMAAPSQANVVHISNIPLTSSENTGAADISNVNGASPLLGQYLYDAPQDYAQGDWYSNDAAEYRPVTEDSKLLPEAVPKGYIWVQLPTYDKRFMRGLKRYGDKSETSEDKRFMRGLPLKRDFDLEDINEGEFPDQEFDEKRFMRGLSQYAKKDDKRFMRGLTDKRFMRGLRSLDPINMDDKRFIVGLNRFARLDDKRFMRGFGSYNKRFIHGLQNYGKRFMRGLVKRDDSAATENNKRFIVGLNGYGRRANVLYNKAVSETADEGDELRKRFMKGFHSYMNTNLDKRFMKGFVSPVGDQEFIDDSDVYNEKRFMRGLTKKQGGSDSETEGTIGIVHSSDAQSNNNNDGYDKRFIKGLIKPDEKRFMRGLVKKSDNSENADKRFIKGLVRKSEDDKRFMRGLNKKVAGFESKRFIKGLALNDDLLVKDANEEESADKRFMRGLAKKNVEEEQLKTISDKRFMRGLYAKKDSNDLNIKNKKFMRGFQNFAKKSDEFTDEDTNNLEEKRFMRGFSTAGMEGKRFIKGLGNNRFGREEKRFIQGLQNYAKKDMATTRMEGSEMIDDKRFMRGLVKKEDVHGDERDEKRFMRGLVKKEGNDNVHNDDKSSGSNNDNVDKVDNEVDKRFMRGLVKRTTGEFRVKRETRFLGDGEDELIQKLVEVGDYGLTDKLPETESGGQWHDFPAYGPGFSLNKRFMRGFGLNVKRGYTSDRSSREFDDIEDVSDDDVDISKRFIRGFTYNKESDFFPKRFHYRLANSDDPDSMSGTDKRFIIGLDHYTRPVSGKRFLRGIQQYGTHSDGSPYLQDKRFMRGLNPYIRTVDKRFIRGLGQYVKRPTDDAVGEIPFPSDRFHKRITGHHYLAPDNERHLASSTFRHPQLMPSYYSDHLTPVQPNFENSLSAESTGVPSRQYLGW